MFLLLTRTDCSFFRFHVLFSFFVVVAVSASVFIFVCPSLLLIVDACWEALFAGEKGKRKKRDGGTAHVEMKRPEL